MQDWKGQTKKDDRIKKMNFPIEKGKVYQVVWKSVKRNTCEVIAIARERYDKKVNLSDVRICQGLDPDDLVLEWELNDIGYPYCCVELGDFDDFPEYLL